MEEKIKRALFGICLYWEAGIETHMRTAAPWTDRTGNARNGLFAEAVEEDDGVFWIIMRHTMHYGFWLEVKNDGRYAIVKPTIIEYGPKVMAMSERLLDRLSERGTG